MPQQALSQQTKKMWTLRHAKLEFPKLQRVCLITMVGKGQQKIHYL